MTEMRPLQSIFLLLILLTYHARGQQMLSVKGSVKDEKNLVLPGATIFLTNTKSITASDNHGEFHLDNLMPGNYQLVVKMIGYAPFVQQLQLKEETVQIKASLKPSSLMLKEVKIHPDYDREKHLALFKKEFLGESENVRYCKLLNPDVLYFSYDKKAKVLTASSDEFLIVENKALGYQIKYLLADFGYNENTRIVTFQGYPSFKELNGNPAQQAKWTEKRRTAYLGSINHFIKAVYRGRTFEEGFVVMKLLNRPMQGIIPEKGKQPLLKDRIISFDSLVTNKNKDFKRLTFSDCLYVIYTKEKEPAEFADYSFGNIKEPAADLPKGQTSLVYLLAPSVDLDKNGLYDPAGGLFFEGYWAWEKAADLMPLDYDPESILK